MAKATNKATLTTTLVIGQVEVPVAVFSATVDKPGKLAEFDTAGPNGGRLMARAVAKATPVEQVPVDEEPVGVIGDPLAVSDPPADPGEVIAEAIDGKRAMDDDAVLDAMEPLDEITASEYQEAQADPRVQELLAKADVAGEYGRELVEEGSGVVVKPQDVRRGVRLEEGRFIDCTAQLAKIEEDTRLDRMTVIGFVDSTQITRGRVRGAKYLGAGDETAPYALRIVFEGLKRTRRMAVVKLTKRSRQTLGAIGVFRGSLVLLELVWAEDVREPPARATVIQRCAVHEREVDMFEALVEAMALPASAMDELRDDAIARREELKAKALAGEVLPAVADAGTIGADDELAAQLAASLAAVGS